MLKSRQRSISLLAPAVLLKNPHFTSYRIGGVISSFSKVTATLESRANFVATHQRRGTVMNLSGIGAVTVLTCALASTVVAQTAVVAHTPVLKAMEAPLYPPLARAARIEGTVTVEITTNGSDITKMYATGGQVMLRTASQDNLKSWRFYPHSPQTFSVTFIYKLESPAAYGQVNPTVLLDLPNRIEIRTKMPTVETTTTDTPPQ